MPTEVELKLAVIPADAPALRRHALFAGVKPVRRRLVNVYYDTPELLLGQKRMALRLRRAGGRWLQTLKAGGGGEAGLHSREEWEFALPSGELDLALFAGTALDALRVARLADRLCPLFTTNFQRTAWIVEPAAGCRVEIALDQGKIACGTREQVVSELELELLAGEPASLFELAARLQHDFALRPDGVSKAERGYRLFRNQRSLPVKAARIELDPGASPPAALRLAARSCLAQLEANVPGVLHGHDTEFVHQARVALMRLRSVLRFAAPPEETAARLNAELRPFAAALGAARDWDVLIDQTLPPIAAACRANAAALRLFGAARRERAKARAAMRVAMTSRPYCAALLSVARWLNEPPPGDSAETGLAQFAAARIRGRHKRLLHSASDLAALTPEQLHRVRIDAKRLRYSAECFASLYHDREAHRYLRELEAIQDALGAINDAAVAEGLVAQLRPAASLGAFIRGWLESHNAGHLAAARRALARLARRKRFWTRPRAVPSERK
jgi:triphosphatase